MSRTKKKEKKCGGRSHEVRMQKKEKKKEKKRKKYTLKRIRNLYKSQLRKKRET